MRLAEGMNVTVPSVCAFERSTTTPRPWLIGAIGLRLASSTAGAEMKGLGWRAKPANARRGELAVTDKDKKVDIPEKVSLTTGQDVMDCLIRKFMTILLLFGDADISSHSFTTNSYGTLAGTVRWITLADVYKLKKACTGLIRLSRAKAEELVDWYTRRRFRRR